MQIFEWQLCGKPIHGYGTSFDLYPEVHQFLTGGRNIPLAACQHQLTTDGNSTRKRRPEMQTGAKTPVQITA